MSENSGEQFDNSEILNFPNDRQNLVVEIGPGGPSTLMLRNISSYMETHDSNYLGIELNTSQNENFAVHAKNRGIDWAKSVHGSIYNFSNELNGRASEVWIRNLFGVGIKKGVESSTAGEIAKASFDILKPEGRLLLLNTYDVLTPKQIDNVRKELEQAGFAIEEIDMEKDTHPLIADHRILEAQLPADIGPKPTKYGFLATK